MCNVGSDRNSTSHSLVFAASPRKCRVEIISGTRGKKKKRKKCDEYITAKNVKKQVSIDNVKEIKRPFIYSLVSILHTVVKNIGIAPPITKLAISAQP